MRALLRRPAPSADSGSCLTLPPLPCVLNRLVRLPLRLYLRQSASSADKSAPLDRVVTPCAVRCKDTRLPDIPTGSFGDGTPSKLQHNLPIRVIPVIRGSESSSASSPLLICVDLRHLRTILIPSTRRVQRKWSNATAPRPHLKPTNASDDRNRRSPTRTVPIRVHQCHPW
jgi:hypothetical protein